MSASALSPLRIQLVVKPCWFSLSDAPSSQPTSAPTLPRTHSQVAFSLAPLKFDVFPLKTIDRMADAGQSQPFAFPTASSECYSEQNPVFMSLSQPATDQPFKTGLDVKSDSQVSRARLHSAVFFKTSHPFDTENHRDEKLTFPFKIPSSIFLLKHWDNRISCWKCNLVEAHFNTFNKLSGS